MPGYYLSAMFLFRRPAVHAVARGCPRRSRRAHRHHRVASCQRRLPDAAVARGARTAVFGLGCFWGAERPSGRPTASSPRPSATPAATRPTRPTRRSAPAGPATPRSCSSSSTPQRISYEELLKVFWEDHDPTQGMRQGNDQGTQYRSGDLLVTPTSERAARRGLPRRLPGAADRGRLRRHHHRDRRRRRVLLRRGLPPAVPRQEPAATAPTTAPAWPAPSASVSSQTEPMRFVLHHSALLHLAEADARIAEEHRLLAPSSSRSHVLSRLHERVHLGDMRAERARQRLAYIRELHLRLLGDAVMQRVAWEVADRLGLSTTCDAEYIALTKLQADALIAMDDHLVGAAQGIVATERSKPPEVRRVCA